MYGRVFSHPMRWLLLAWLCLTGVWGLAFLWTPSKGPCAGSPMALVLPCLSDGSDVKDASSQVQMGVDLGVGFERWELQRGARLERSAGRHGERRVVVCEVGELSITVGTSEHRLRAGEMAVIDAAVRPAFESRGRGVSIVYSVAG